MPVMWQKCYRKTMSYFSEFHCAPCWIEIYSWSAHRQPLLNPTTDTAISMHPRINTKDSTALFGGQSNAQHCFSTDERQRKIANGELSGFFSFSQIWLMTELSRGRHTSQSTASAELLQKSFLHLCPSHFIFCWALWTWNYSTTWRHSQTQWRNVPQGVWLVSCIHIIYETTATY